MPSQRIATARHSELPRLWAQPQIRKTVFCVLAAMAVAAGLAAAIAKGHTEIDSYVRAAARVTAGDSLYVSTDPKPFPYPPFMVIPFLPLVTCPAAWQRALFFLANILCLVGVGAQLRQIATLAFPSLDRHQRRLLWVGIAIVSGRYMASALAHQSNDLLVLLVLSLGVCQWVRNRAGAGATLGIAAALKATPALFLVPLLLQRRTRMLVLMILAMIGASLLPDLIAPRHDGRPRAEVWFREFVKPQTLGAPAAEAGDWTSANPLNQSLAGTLHRLTRPLPASEATGRAVDVAIVSLGPRTARALVGTASGLVLLWLMGVVGAVIPSHPEERRWTRLGQASAVLCAMVLLSPMSSKSHFGVLAIVALFCIGTWLTRGRGALLGALLVIVVTLGTLSSRGLLGHSLGYVLLGYGTTTWSAVAALAATTVSLGRRRSRSAVESG